jgi:CRISPR/Cas system CSM-associated protein Csm4 (group 5 of RAMP superfamily)
MHNSELVRIARDSYVNTRNLSRTFKELKKEGYIVSERTLQRWKTEGQWDMYCKKYDEQLTAYNELVLSYEKEIVKDLIYTAERLKKQMDRDGDIDSQLAYAYMKISDQIMKYLTKDKGNEDEMFDKMVQAMSTVKEVAEVLIRNKSAILKAYKKIIK